MTGGKSFFDSQMEFLARSLSDLGDICKVHSLEPRVLEVLGEVSPRLAMGVNAPSQSPGLVEALEVLRQVRASLALLKTAGSLLASEGDGPAPRLSSALDDLERELGERLRRTSSHRVYGLYVIIDPEVTGGRDPFEIARAALRGGARMLQLRDKLREKGQTLPLARALREMSAAHKALLIVNDHADLARIVEADGLHVGQGDLPVAEVRQLLGPHQMIGRSNHLLEEAVESQALGADHVALGAIYLTATKASIIDRAPIGPEAVRRVKGAVSVPVVAIGGINEENLGPVVEAGADAICVTGAVGLAKDPEQASRQLVEAILRAGGKA